MVKPTPPMNPAIANQTLSLLLIHNPSFQQGEFSAEHKKASITVLILLFLTGETFNAENFLDI
jgi:hypothetical protein